MTSPITETPLIYLKNQLGGNFYADWKSLTSDDQAKLRQWAVEEITAINAEAK